MSLRALMWVVVFSLFASGLYADGPRDNDLTRVRRVPPLGIEIDQKDRVHFEAGLKRLHEKMDQLKKSKDVLIKRLIPDVEIFYRALRTTMAHQEFFHNRDVVAGRRILEEGIKRADLLLKGKSPWTTQTGFVVRGFRSRLDDTVQPYGLEVPASFTTKANGKRYRCDLWFHGRGERVSEVNFIDQRMRRGGKYKPRETIIVHPYGRYSNAFKFAGEVDVFEGLADAKKNYPIDEDRISVRGFSMGGAGCWQMAVHYPGLFFAATPGAGFSETPEFLKVFQNETLKPRWFEKELWKLYDCPGYAVNLSNCPTIAYSGEIDRQKQAADVMEAALKSEGIDLVHLIGPKTGHKIHPDSAIEIERRMESLSRRGINRVPESIRFSTFTLKYNRVHWLSIDGLGEHWRQARVRATMKRNESVIVIKTKNIDAMSVHFDSGLAPFDLFKPVMVSIDGVELNCGHVQSDLSFRSSFYRSGDGWKNGRRDESGLRKKHGLQGPVDDAFMDRFIFVVPTGKSSMPKVNEWVQSELKRAKIHWRQQMRGDVRVVKDIDLTEKQISNSNLILWGDPTSNKVLQNVIGGLPIRWTDSVLDVDGKEYAITHHAPILIFPNPLNSKRYVVLNSSFTYREYAYLNNARQVPMLPDWAVVDLNTAAGTRFPGKIVTAGFFDERWQFKVEGKVRKGE